jgi:hypothetical protein
VLRGGKRRVDEGLDVWDPRARSRCCHRCSRNGERGFRVLFVEERSCVATSEDITVLI